MFGSVAIVFLVLTVADFRSAGVTANTIFAGVAAVALGIAGFTAKG
jgi:hypothetical protein